MRLRKALRYLYPQKMFLLPMFCQVPGHCCEVGPGSKTLRNKLCFFFFFISSEKSRDQSSLCCGPQAAIYQGLWLGSPWRFPAVPSALSPVSLSCCPCTMWLLAHLHPPQDPGSLYFLVMRVSSGLPGPPSLCASSQSGLQDMVQPPLPPLSKHRTCTLLFGLMLKT